MIELKKEINLVDSASRPQLLDLLTKITFLFREGDSNFHSSATYTKEWMFKTLNIRVEFK